MTPTYTPRRRAASRFVALRGLRYHLTTWGEPTPGGAPPLVMMHGWMDIGASFQFVVDALAAERQVIAADWRGFGQTEAPAATDAYWFADYLGDLDALLDAISPDAPVDLAGHSMGGNVVMTYAGVRPQRVRRLINLEGFGLPDMPPDAAPGRLAKWLDELKVEQRLRDFASLDEVAARLCKTNPRLAADKAAWLAGQWAAPDGQGRWRLRADAAHKRINPVPYRAAEAVAVWRAITAPLLWVQGDRVDLDRHWGGRYTEAEFQQRLAVVPQVTQCKLRDAGHMLHHDQPEALAAAIEAHLG
jgi:pimeloyl-ACP methyl ester carboxylesterase